MVATHDITTDVSTFPVLVKDEQGLCSRVIACVLSVKNGESPEWMKKRLLQCDIRPLGVLIDITNYIMLELGHPSHVFDADLLGDTMNIRSAHDGESTITLDGVTRTLAEGDIVIANKKDEIIDLVGIMGTANSVVRPETKRILFFIDHPHTKNIRRTSMRLALRTKAAQLNEKELDPTLALESFQRGLRLYRELASGKFESPILDIFPEKNASKKIRVDQQEIQRYLGIKIPPAQCVKILSGLGCEVEQESDVFFITPPTWRPDLAISADIIEEIARVYGYHNLPSAILDTRIPTIYPPNTDFALEHRVKEVLADLGAQEVYSYSTVSTDVARESGFELSSHLKIQNPLNEEHVYLRQSMIPSHLEILEKNAQYAPLTVFELANLYHPQENDLPFESLHLTITSEESLDTVRGYLNALLCELHIPANFVELKQEQASFVTIQIHTQGDEILDVGTLATLPKNRFSVDLTWARVLYVRARNPEYHPLAKFAPIREDLTFTLPADLKIGAFVSSMRNADSKIVNVEFVTMYHQNVTLRVAYSSEEKQLTTDDAAQIRQSLIAEAQKLGATLVGQV
ncbi:MAG TPA: hypothetical protein DCW55_01855 [Candidatus Pacebacteria bacterium]|nr:hypothetical protein [Candidatus Paceibacterota bacterium]